MYRMFDFFFFFFINVNAFYFLNMYSRSTHYINQSLNGIFAPTASPVKVAVLEGKIKLDCIKTVLSAPKTYLIINRPMTPVKM